MLAVKTYSRKDIVDFYADVDIDQFRGECWIGALSKKEAIEMLEGMIAQVKEVSQ